MSSGGTLASIITAKNLRDVWTAHEVSSRNTAAGVDGVRAAEFRGRLGQEIAKMRRELRDNKFKFHGLLAIPIEKENRPGKYRIICVPTLRDRLLQRAIQAHLTTPDLLSEIGIDPTVGYGVIPRADNGVHSARRDAAKHRNVRPWVFKTDVSAFFDTIARDELKRVIRTSTRKRSLYPILDAVVDCEISRGVGPDWKALVQQAGILKGQGLRQGMPLSPFLSSLFLREFDQWSKQEGLLLVRYIDDIAVFCATEEEAREAGGKVVTRLQALGLAVPEIGPGSKTQIFSPDERAQFLGLAITMGAGGRYELQVDEFCFERAEAKFENFTTQKFIETKGLDVISFANHLKRARDGYRFAYSGATNLDGFSDHLDDLMALTMRATLSRLLGVENMKRLSVEAEKFFMLTDDEKKVPIIPPPQNSRSPSSARSFRNPR